MPPEPSSESKAIEALIESSTDAMYVMDDKGRIRFWSWGAEQMYGIGKAEAATRTLFELIIPFDRRQELTRMLKESLETGSAIGDTVRKKKDQTAIQVQTLIRSLAPDSSSVRWYAISDKDVTEQKRFEQTVMEQVWSLTGVQTFLQSILDGTRDYSILAVDLDGKIQEWNAGASRDFGYEPVEVRGQNCRPLLHSDDNPDPEHIDKAFQTALEKGVFEGEVQAVREDGSRFPGRITINLRKGPYDDPIGFVIILKNVTEEKRAEEERRIAQARLIEIQKLEEMNLLKTNLLNTASHELNTPLTPIRLQVHMLKSGTLGELDERQQKAVGVLSRNVERLAEVVQQILDVTRMQGEKIELVRKPLDLASFLRRSANSFEEPARRAALQLDVMVAEALQVSADVDRLSQVAASLLNNAIKFTPKGGRIRVIAVRDREHAIVRVEDSGIGLSADQIGKLFQPFSQVHDTMQITNAGPGLSLYLARGIVEAHGGRIWCESTGVGKGATFSFTLPIARADDGTAPSEAKRPLSGPDPVQGQ